MRAKGWREKCAGVGDTWSLFQTRRRRAWRVERRARAQQEEERRGGGRLWREGGERSGSCTRSPHARSRPGAAGRLLAAEQRLDNSDWQRRLHRSGRGGAAAAAEAAQPSGGSARLAREAAAAGAAGACLVAELVRVSAERGGRQQLSAARAHAPAKTHPSFTLSLVNRKTSPSAGMVTARGEQERAHKLQKFRHR